MNQVAAKLSAGLGRKATCVEVSPDVMRKSMEAARVTEWLASYAVGVAEY